MMILHINLPFASAMPTSSELVFLMSMIFVAVFSYKMASFARKPKRAN